MLDMAISPSFKLRSIEARKENCDIAALWFERSVRPDECTPHPTMKHTTPIFKG
jgi:hypothetical protein